MNRHWVSFLLILSLPSLLAAAPLEPEFLAKIPADLRATAERVLTTDDQARLRKASESKLRYWLLLQFATVPTAAATVLAELPTEPAATRAALLSTMAYAAHWPDVPDVDRALQRLVAGDRDPEVVTKALETLRTIEMKRLRSALAQRVRAARSAGDTAMVDSLIAEDDRYVSLQRGTMLPTFLRRPPDVFSVKPKESPVRIVAFGDFGRGRPGQSQVAHAIARLHKEKPFDFGVTTGDNFYGSGMHSPDDERWKPQWEELYTPLGIPFYASLGNHDWLHPDAPAAEILYAAKSASWRMPAPYYSFTAGPAQFFVLSTDDFSEAQAQWLERSTAASKATWKVVVGHHPIYVASTFGDSYTAEMRERVWPLIKGKVDAYLCGHHHSLQHLKPEDGVHFFVTGAGGESTYPVNKSDARALFAEAVLGYLIVEVDPDRLAATFYDTEAKPLHSHTLRKRLP